jgi:hypothetical protein
VGGEAITEATKKLGEPLFIRDTVGVGVGGRVVMCALLNCRRRFYRREPTASSSRRRIVTDRAHRVAALTRKAKELPESGLDRRINKAPHVCVCVCVCVRARVRKHHAVLRGCANAKIACGRCVDVRLPPLRGHSQYIRVTGASAFLPPLDYLRPSPP